MSALRRIGVLYGPCLRNIPSASKSRWMLPVMHPEKPRIPAASQTWCREYAKKSKKDKGGKSSGKHVELTDEEINDVIDAEKMRTQMKQVVEDLHGDYVRQMSLRTSAGIFDTLIVDTEDGKFPLNQLAQVAQKNPQLIVINMAAVPQYIPAVKDAIENSGMNINPQQDAHSLFIPVPRVSREHRESLAKSAKTIADKSKSKLRDVHAKYTKQAKNARATHSEDLIHNIQELVLKSMHDHSSQIDKLQQAKQKELLDTK